MKHTDFITEHEAQWIASFVKNELQGSNIPLEDWNFIIEEALMVVYYGDRISSISVISKDDPRIDFFLKGNYDYDHGCPCCGVAYYYKPRPQTNTGYYFSYFYHD